MTYLLSPFTDLVLQLFSIGPFWTLYMGTILAAVGLIFVLSDKSTIMALVVALTSKAKGPITASVNAGLGRKIGLVVLLTGLAVSAAGTDAVASTPSYSIIYGGGGPSLVACLPPLNFLPCFPPAGQNSTNICTSSNIASSSCQVPACNADPAILQCSASSATITIITGASSGTVAIPFSPAFSTIPKGIALIPRTLSTTTATNPTYSATFLATTSAGQTWTNMPAAQTEIFGDTTHEVALVGSGAPFLSATLASFSVDCPPGLGSTSATAVLRPMFSLDSGATWNPVASVATGLDFGINVSCVLSSAPVTTIAAALTAATASNVAFRVDGLNGGGVGDSPVFTQIQLTFYVQQSYYPTFSVLSKSASSMTVQAIYASKNQAGSITDTFDWIAHK